MEAYCHMLSTNHLFGDVHTIKVDLKSDIRQNFGELAVVE